MNKVILVAALCVVGSLTAKGQQQQLRSTRAHDAVEVQQGRAVPATRVAEARVSVKLTEADARKRGEVWLELAGESGTTRLTIKIPLSSTEDAYGESRACITGADGSRKFVFTAGLDEANFTAFAHGTSDLKVTLLVNKYLCRALAAPFNCAGTKVAMPADWKTWSFGGRNALALSSDAPARLQLSPLVVVETAKEFDPRTCAVIAPSNGMCCVGGKQTNWHCGGKPDGSGWHQVSGDCFHQETGGTCTQ